MAVPMQKLLIVSNVPSANTTALVQAVLRGAKLGAESELDIVVSQPLDANSHDVQSAAGIIIGTTENFGAMSGLIKDFFERIYYDCIDKTEAKPFALYVRAGQDGQGTLQGVQRITTGLKWKLMQPPLLLHGTWQDQFLSQCEELGANVAAGLVAGIY